MVKTPLQSLPESPEALQKWIHGELAETGSLDQIILSEIDLTRELARASGDPKTTRDWFRDRLSIRFGAKIFTQRDGTRISLWDITTKSSASLCDSVYRLNRDGIRALSNEFDCDISAPLRRAAGGSELRTARAFDIGQGEELAESQKRMRFPAVQIL
jgi:hypothetical protein